MHLAARHRGQAGHSEQTLNKRTLRNTNNHHPTQIRLMQIH